MGAEKILKLFDSHWFEHAIFTSKPCLTSTTKPIHDQHHQFEKPKVHSTESLHVHSQSDRCLSYNIGLTLDSASQKSRQKIIFGTEMCDSSKGIEEQEKLEMTTKKRVPMSLSSVIPKSSPKLKGFEFEFHSESNLPKRTKKRASNRSRRRRRMRTRGISRSLSELEHQELRGFMDLGFVFTEEDKTSSLVAIIPGLQKMGIKDSDGRVNDAKHRVSRPYLSEAWGVLNGRRVNKQLMQWRFPDMYNEINMKGHLKAWAQMVASTVK